MHRRLLLAPASEAPREDCSPLAWVGGDPPADPGPCESSGRGRHSCTVPGRGAV